MDREAQTNLLTRAQRAALDFADNGAGSRQDSGADLTQALSRNDVPEAVYDEALVTVRTQGRVVLAFHPERVGESGNTVAEGLATDGAYKNQFETGLSSGSTSAVPGGRRDEWERRLFGGAYHAPGVESLERPKYGALSLVRHADGPCPRFGSSYLVLRPEVSSRCSFTPQGSQEESAQDHTGTLSSFDPVMVGVADHMQEHAAPFGVEKLGLREFLDAMAGQLPIVPPRMPADQLGRALDSFVEAQVHGPIDLKRDVESMVIDSSFHGTPTGHVLRELSSGLGIPLNWHPGFTLEATEFPQTFRGFPTRRVADRVASGGVVNAPILGAGQNDFVRNPGGWGEFGTKSEVLTSFRRVWHFLVLSGRPSPQWPEVSR
ncbi:MAG: DUF3626 domain-containing protein [Longimicrobiales bacterium]